MFFFALNKTIFTYSFIRNRRKYSQMEEFSFSLMIFLYFANNFELNLLFIEESIQNCSYSRKLPDAEESITQLS